MGFEGVFESESLGFDAIMYILGFGFAFVFVSIDVFICKLKCNPIEERSFIYSLLLFIHSITAFQYQSAFLFLDR